MPQRILMIATALLLAGAAPPEDLQPLQGAWRMIRSEMKGKKLGNYRETIRFSGDQFSETLESTGTGEIRLKSSDGKTTYTWTRDVDSHYIESGFFEIVGDRFRKCFSLRLPGNEVPTTLESKPGSRVFLETWRRTEGKAGSDPLDGT